MKVLENIYHEILTLASEVNCRWEHGADGKENLQYVERELRNILRRLDIQISEENNEH